MNQILTVMKSYLTFFLLLMLLLNLVPRETYKKYIRFFMGLLLAYAFLSPVLSFLFDQEDFLDQIEYEMFREELSELSQNAKKMEFLQEEQYLEQYEKSIEADITRIAKEYLFEVEQVSIEWNDSYEVETISLTITSDTENQIIIGKITVGDEKSQEDSLAEQAVYKELKEELMLCYQLEEGQLTIQYD